jgi:endoglucanase
LLRGAVQALEANGNTGVYLDAGNPHWMPADQMAKRLKAAGVDQADGFALNVSNYMTTRENIAYGRAISALVGGKHFVIDTSRNGNGPTADFDWCNPHGRAIGKRPTGETGEALVDAYLWIKRPGESDGECKGAPKAGEFWQDMAVELVNNAKD